MFRARISQGNDFNDNFSLASAVLASRSTPAAYTLSGGLLPHVGRDDALAAAGHVKSPDALAAPPVVTGGSYTIGFDDLVSSGDGVALPTGYDGYNWSNIFSASVPGIETSFGAGTGYSNGEISPDNVAFIGSGFTGQITAADGISTFTLQSLNLTAAWDSSLQVDIYGYRGALQAYHLIYSITDAHSALATVNFKNVDRVTIVGSNGIDDPAITTGSGDHIVIDDIKFAAGSITGTVFRDVLGNGINDGADTGISGRKVFIDLNGNGILDPGEARKTTAADGSFTFGNLLPGDYNVYQILPKTWVQTTQSPVSTYEATTAAYAWVEVGQAANKLTTSGLDEGTAFVNTPALTRFFGAAQAGFAVSTNGFLDTSGGNTFVNQLLPNSGSSGALGGIIAPYWDDLSFVDGTGGIYFKDDTANSRYIVEWKNAGFFADTTARQHVTFEAIIGYDGTITYQYNQLDDRGSGATVGIANIDGTLGSTITYNSASLLAHSAYTLTPILTTPVAVVHVNSGQQSHVDFGGLPASSPHAPHADPVSPHAFASIAHGGGGDLPQAEFATPVHHFHLDVMLV